MNTQICNENSATMAVDFFHTSNAFATFLDVINKVSFPTELVKILSRIDCNKFNPTEQEYVKQMATTTAFTYKDQVDLIEIENALQNCKVDCEFISDVDYKMSKMINEQDLAMFD